MQIREVSGAIEAIREGPGVKQDFAKTSAQEWPRESKKEGVENRGKEQLGPQEAKEVVFAVQEELEKLNVRLVFNVDEDTKEIVVKVVDPKTNEVIKQIPPEELLEIRKKLDEIVGILFDVRV